MSNYKYTGDMEAHMREAVASGVTFEAIDALAKEFNFPNKSISAKLRSLGLDVPTKTEAPKFSAEETKAFSDFLTANSGQLTAVEIAAKFMDGHFTNRQIQGKALALEMTSHIKKTDKVEKPRIYTADEESLVTKLVGEGKFIEEIAEALGKDVKSVRGKLLSMKLHAPQRDKKATSTEGTYADLVTLAPTMTVAELVEHYKSTKPDTTPRGVKTALSRRKINAKDYTHKSVAA